MKTLVLSLFFLLAFSETVEQVATNVTNTVVDTATTAASTVTNTTQEIIAPVANTTVPAPEKKEDLYNQIPAYGPQAEILEAVGRNYPTEKQHHFGLLSEQLIADNGNQFKRIHAEIQKNNEKPFVYDSEKYIPTTVPRDVNHDARLLEEFATFENSLLPPSAHTTGLDAVLEDEIGEFVKTPYPAEYKLPTPPNLRNHYDALNEHQLNTEVQLHRLIHAMDMVSESIQDPLRDKYQRGINEMLAKHLDNTRFDKYSPLNDHLRSHHAFHLHTPELGETIAHNIYNSYDERNGLKLNPVPGYKDYQSRPVLDFPNFPLGLEEVQMPPYHKQPTYQSPSTQQEEQLSSQQQYGRTNTQGIPDNLFHKNLAYVVEDKDDLRQKTLEQNQVRPL